MKKEKRKMSEKEMDKNRIEPIIDVELEQESHTME